MSLKKIVVTGAGGQLATCIKELTTQDDQIVFLSQQELDITSRKATESVLDKHQSDFLINCAAYTAVDQAETDREVCRKVNVDGASNLAECSKSLGFKLIHISTDFVYDDHEAKPKKEHDKLNPKSWYAITKADGEKAIMHTSNNFLIVRTSWLYSAHGHNFFNTMSRFAKEEKTVKVVSDQIGTPTHALDLAQFLLGIVRNEYSLSKNTVLNFSNLGVASWYDFAFEIYDYYGKSKFIHPTDTSGYPTPAKRPQYSLMDKSKLTNELGVRLNHWKTSLRQQLNTLNQR